MTSIINLYFIIPNSLHKIQEGVVLVLATHVFHFFLSNTYAANSWASCNNRPLRRSFIHKLGNAAPSKLPFDTHSATLLLSYHPACTGNPSVTGNSLFRKGVSLCVRVVLTLGQLDLVVLNSSFCWLHNLLLCPEAGQTKLAALPRGLSGQSASPASYPGLLSWLCWGLEGCPLACVHIPRGSALHFYHFP